MSKLPNDERIRAGAEAGYTARVGERYAAHQPWSTLTDYGHEQEMAHYRAAIEAAESVVRKNEVEIDLASLAGDWWRDVA